jgi:hypothetical protein
MVVFNSILFMNLEVGRTGMVDLVDTTLPLPIKPEKKYAFKTQKKNSAGVVDCAAEQRMVWVVMRC